MLLKNKKLILSFILLVLLASLLSCNIEYKHICKFNCMTVQDEFLVSEASCTERAVYSYSCKCGKVGTDTFEYGSVLGHDFSLMRCDKKALLDEENCNHPSIYYYSCSRCGEIGTETFENGAKKEHNFVVKVLNSQTRIPGQKYSCTTPYRYYYSCSCGKISDSEIFEANACSGHLFVELADEKYKKIEQNVPSCSEYYKHCIFCGEISSETFFVQIKGDSENTSPTNILYYIDEGYCSSVSAHLTMSSSFSYVLKVSFYNEPFVCNIENYSGEREDLTLLLYRDKNCTLLVDEPEFEELSGGYYLFVSSPVDAEIDLFFS